MGSRILMRAGESVATAEAAKHWGVFLTNVAVFTLGAQEHGQSTLGNRQACGQKFERTPFEPTVSLLNFGVLHFTL